VGVSAEAPRGPASPAPAGAATEGPAAAKDAAARPAPGAADDGPLPAWAYLVFAAACVLFLAVATIYYFVQLPLYLRTVEPGTRLTILVTSSAALLFTIFTLGRYLGFMGFAYLAAAREEAPPPAVPLEPPPVSILVPAFNEAGRIELALDSMLALDYEPLEVIVVDDGSTDDTFARASCYAGRHGEKTIRVLRKPNGGKSTALNLAFRNARSPLVMCVDADSHLAPDSLALLVRRLEEPSVAACCGQVRVRNREGITTQCQALEYVLLNGMPRQFQSYFETVLIAPGPISLFRRSALEAVWGRIEAPLPPTAERGPGFVDGPWESDTFAEDADLSMRVLVRAGTIVYEPRALAFTSAPTWMFPLLNQRYRWVRGTLQATMKAWRCWRATPGARPHLPFWYAYQMIDTLLWPLVSLLGTAQAALLAALVGLNTPMVAWIGLIIAMELNAAAFCVKIERDSPRLLLFMPLFRAWFNVILDVGRVFAVWDELRGRRMSWS
jgi:cellulose synthase/poly-beta-1,6-N-acetylglucosamine synthase-like glycosyltransferase